MKNRILVAEDEESIGELLCMNLEAAGYETVYVRDGKEAASLLQAERGRAADLALVDVMMPGFDGFELMDFFLRFDIPVIYLTAKGDVASKVKGLKMGAEDYIVKPFEILELLVRMEKVLERTGRMGPRLTAGSLEMDLSSRKVWESGKEILLKPMEFHLLAAFLKNRNVVLSRDRLLNMVWGSDYEGETRTVDVHVASLRKKLKTASSIRTVPKAGYLFEDGTFAGRDER